MSRPGLACRVALPRDLPAIMAMLADDEISRGREAGVTDAVRAAFEEIARDPNQDVLVLEKDGRVVGTAQLSVLPGLSRGAMKRGLVEAVRVEAGERGGGLGRWFMGEIERIARERGCRMIQLSSDKRRTDAHRFYRTLGYDQSHEGFKRVLG